MKKGLKIIFIVIGIIIVLGTIFFAIDYGRTKKHKEELPKNNYNIVNDVFNAKIKEIKEYNGITTVLIEGIESNDIKYRGEFDFSINNDTELLWKETKIELSSLKEGQNVLITSTGDVLESSPAELTKVIKVVVLDDEL